MSTGTPRRRGLAAAVALFVLAGCGAGTSSPNAPDEPGAPNEREAGGDGQAATDVTRTSEMGPVKAQVTLRPSKPVIGDTVTLRIEVTAERDVDVLMPEFGDALERFGIIAFAPGTVRVDENARSVHVQEYTLEPRLSGKQSIPPILIEFVDRRAGQKASPEGEDAYELVTERLDFEVASVLPAEAGGELRPALGALEPLPEKLTAAQRIWPWAVAALALCVALPLTIKAFAAYRRRARRRSAYDIARARLARLIARPRPAPQEMDAFFVELSAIVRRYLEDRFELRAPEYTTEEFLAAASRSPDLGEEHRRVLRDFLRQADLVKFAHFVPNPSDIEGALRLAQTFLDETRENAPFVEEPEEAPARAEVARV